MTEPKLLTEAEARSILMRLGNGWTVDDQVNHLRERGLIAPEPDPLREIVEDLWHISVGPKGEAVTKMLAELRRRGVTLAKPELTREMVRDAVIAARGATYGSEMRFSIDEDWLTALHAALTKGEGA